ncbi:MAG: beta-propeller domain-containing protein, partial [Oscillospiraceae bacterium]|nr:beta-propeller domain-containing protein [Oscillospiraceae bacterium]
LSVTALLVVAVSVVLLVGGSANSAGSGAALYRPPENIVSDGDVYKVKMIDSILAETEAKETLPVVGNKETLLKLLKERGAMTDAGGWGTDGIARDSVAENEAGASAAPSDTSGNFSDTNEQVAGVNEGDIVKTDGKYLYALADNKLRIIDAAAMKVVSVIELRGDLWGQEFYLIGDKLVIVAQEYVTDIVPLYDGVDTETDLPEPDAASRVAPEMDMWMPQRNFTVLAVYDITDRAAPAETRHVSLDGWNVATRVIGDTVYMVTNKPVWGVPYDAADSEDILPYVRDTEGEYVPFPYDNIYYIPGTTDSSYLLIGTLNVNDDAPFEPKAYLGAGSQLYMSLNAMYLTQWRYLEGTETEADGNVIWEPGEALTDILRFTVEDGDVFYSGKGTVSGSPISQYSMDEHDGYFRIATTAWGVGSYVSVLDADMKPAGRVGPLMPDEQLQSMRFMGDLGYIVTFENTDPLFTIDLSDPHNPKVLGELKIPGFSQYLHPVGEGMLLGIGRDTQELYTRDENGVETVVGFRDVGLKVSLFDVTDPYNPKEADVLRLGEGYADVTYNPRALMCDPQRGLYGFIMDRWNMSDRFWSAFILRVDGGELSVAAELNPEEQYNYNNRLCFIGNKLYLIGSTGVVSYDYNTFAEIKTLTWQDAASAVS